MRCATLRQGDWRGPMKFFVDTADLGEIRELAATGLVDGVTTNPTLVAKAGRDFREIVAEICATVPGPVSAEVAATDLDGMLKEGRALAKIANNVAVKVPLTWAGLKACRALAAEGTMVNVTLCFSANQALLAAKAGATFVSPFVGASTTPAPTAWSSCARSAPSTTTTPISARRSSPPPS